MISHAGAQLLLHPMYVFEKWGRLLQQLYSQNMANPTAVFLCCDSIHHAAIKFCGLLAMAREDAIFEVRKLALCHVKLPTNRLLRIQIGSFSVPRIL